VNKVTVRGGQRTPGGGVQGGKKMGTGDGRLTGKALTATRWKGFRETGGRLHKKKTLGKEYRMVGNSPNRRSLGERISEDQLEKFETTNKERNIKKGTWKQPHIPQKPPLDGNGKEKMEKVRLGVKRVTWVCGLREKGNDPKKNLAKNLKKCA